MRGPGSRNSAACHGGSRLPAVLAVATLATYTPPEPLASTPAGAGAAQDLRSGPGPIGGEWPDRDPGPFQNDRASASETAAAVDVIMTHDRLGRSGCIVVPFKLMSAIIIPAANHPRQGRLPFWVRQPPMHSSFSGPPHLRRGACWPVPVSALAGSRRHGAACPIRLWNSACNLKSLMRLMRRSQFDPREVSVVVKVMAIIMMLL
jgi:hypothetical protein